MSAPFFIVGCGRSGTTLLRTMLDHHPDVAIPVESLFIIDYLRAADRVSLATMRRMIVREHELKEWQINITADDLADCTSIVDIITRLHERYAQQHAASRWGQKTPRFIRYGQLLKQAYPAAKFVHVLRDPRAVVNSLVRSNVHSSNVYYGALRWQKDVRAGRELAADFPDDVLEVYYEALVSEPESVLRDICDFLALPFDRAMLDYHRAEHSEYSGYHATIHAQLNRPPNTSRIDAWRDKLTPDDVTLIEQVCSPLMAEVGYAPERAGQTVPDGMIQRLKWERRTRGIWRQLRQYFNGRTYHLFYSMYRKARLGLLRDAAGVNY